MEFLTVKDFAEAAGVTVQAIYPRIKKDLAQFCKDENGVKLIEKSALDLFNSNQQTKRDIELKKQLQALEEENASLKSIIEQLKLEKEELQNKSADFSAQLLQILEKQTQQQENYQVLMAQQIQFIQSSLILPPSSVEESLKEDNKVELKVEKPSLIKRLFRRT